MKINVDASWCANTNVARLAAVARDHSGSIVTRVLIHTSAPSARSAEAMDLRLGSRLVKEKGQNVTILESDNKQVVWSINGKLFDD